MINMYTNKIRNTIESWDNEVKEYNEKCDAIDSDTRLSAEAKHDDKADLKAHMNERLSVYRIRLESNWNDLKDKLTVEPNGEGVQEVAQALTVITTIGKNITPELFDTIITAGMRKDIGSMRQIRAAIDAAGLYEKIEGCTAFEVLKNYETINNEILDAEQHSYRLLADWEQGLKYAIGKSLLLSKLDEFETRYEIISSGEVSHG